jgi:methyltransferase (TIGR00027 family)
MNKNMTALMSCFVRYYHTKNSNITIYSDKDAKKILTEKEIEDISSNLANGISYFNPNYKGNNPLEWIVNNNLAPSVLARSIFNEKHLINEIKLGLKQYVILASGYDTSAFKYNKILKVFELDKKEMIEDKLNRINNTNLDKSNITYIKTDFNKEWINSLLDNKFDTDKKSFCSMLGISYYLDKEIFKNTIKVLSDNISKGSVILFDYPNNFETKKEKINQELAKALDEEMKSTYSYKEIEDIASKSNMLIYEHLNNNDIDNNYFYNYNTLNPNNRIIAPKGVSYVMLVKE